MTSGETADTTYVTQGHILNSKNTTYTTSLENVSSKGSNRRLDFCPSAVSGGKYADAQKLHRQGALTMDKAIPDIAKILKQKLELGSHASTKTIWQCMQNNGTLSYVVNKFMLFFDDEEDRAAHHHSRLFCWIRVSIRRAAGTVVSVKFKDCRSKNVTIVVYEVDFSQPTRPQIQPLVDVCKDGNVEDYFGQTSHLVLLVTTSGSVSYTSLFLEVIGRSMDELEVHYSNETGG